jgi:DivIVA domain-containing protein
MSTNEPPRTGSDEHLLTPAQIERQDFARARKGLDEKEVRTFLRRVADDFDALTRRVADLEGQLRHPPLPSRDQLVELVGQEVARTLRSAEESAEKVAQRAREAAAGIERTAREDSARIRTEQLEHANNDSHAIVEAARERAREMVAEARALRERVLFDLNRRRDTLRAYIDQLRADRDRFAEAYRVIRDTVSDANELLTRLGSGRPFPPVTVEAGPPFSYPSETSAPPDHPSRRRPEPEPSSPEIAARQAASTPPPGPSRSRPAPATGFGLGELPGQPEPPPPAIRSPGLSPDLEPETDTEVASTGPAEAEREAEPEHEPEPGADGEPEPVSPGASDVEARPEPDTGSDVDALFERLRSARVEATERQAPAAEPRAGDDDGGGSHDRGEPGRAERAPQASVLVGTAPEPRPATTAPTDGDPELLARRDELLTPIAHELVRRCKRVLQNEQNEILDGLRRQRGRPAPDMLLPPLAQQVTAWSEVLSPAIVEAYVAARTAASPKDDPVTDAPQRMVTGMVEVLVTPLRDRLLAAVDETLGDDANPDVIAHRIGARYREWKGEELDNRIRDLLAAVYARGVYDAAPEGVRLRWVPAEQGQCPDADDNALEPTRRGERFPTGQQFPPAHPGCRCLLAVMHEQRGDE